MGTGSRRAFGLWSRVGSFFKNLMAELTIRTVYKQFILCISNKQIKISKYILQTMICMNDYVVRTPDHLQALVQGFRKQAGLTQSEMAKRLGITQQTLSAFERNADKASADRLLEYLSILGVELVLRQPRAGEPTRPETDW